jgi:hypothetical protein
MGPWAQARKLEAYAGEVRVNFIRLLALVVFYAQHLVNVYVFKEGVTPEFHTAVTALVLAWAAVVVGLHLCLTRRWMPDWLKYASTILDLTMITALGVLARDPRSPLTVLFFLAIATAPLRLSLGLVYVATLGAIAGYGVVLGYYVYIVIGSARYYAEPSGSIRVPRATELIMVLALGTAGFLAGQVVRQMRRLVQGHAVTIDWNPEP